MKLTKGKIAKLHKKKQQSLKKKTNLKRKRANHNTLRKRSVNLANKTFKTKQIPYSKLGGDPAEENTPEPNTDNETNTEQEETEESTQGESKEEEKEPEESKE